MEEKYLAEKQRLDKLNLTYEEYEKALREWCKQNNY